MGSIAHRIRMAMALLSLVAGASAQGQLLVVDEAGGPGSQFTSIADAVAVAPAGATVLVRTGSYEPFVVDGKTLVIVGAPGAQVEVEGSLGSPTPITVRNVAPSEVVVLEGLVAFGGGDDIVVVENCGGQVWLQDLLVESFSFESSPLASLQVTNCNRVLLVRCDIGGVGFGFADGLHATQSRVFVWESTLHGGKHPLQGGKSGTGAVIEGGMLFAEGSGIVGGIGVHDILPLGGCYTITSGDGLHLSDQARAIVFDTDVYAGGSAGTVFGCTSFGTPTVIEPGSSFEMLPGESASFSVESPVLDGQETTLEIAGEPGDLPFVMVATAVAPVTYFPKYKGALAIGNPFFVVLSPLPVSGTASLPFGFGDGLTDGTGSTVFLQGAVFKAAGGGLLADAMTLTIWEE